MQISGGGGKEGKIVRDERFRIKTQGRGGQAVEKRSLAGLL